MQTENCKPAKKNIFFGIFPLHSSNYHYVSGTVNNWLCEYTEKGTALQTQHSSQWFSRWDERHQRKINLVCGMVMVGVCVLINGIFYSFVSLLHFLHPLQSKEAHDRWLPQTPSFLTFAWENITYFLIVILWIFFGCAWAMSLECSLITKMKFKWRLP